MGKTSVYLNRDLSAAWKASGLPLAELVRRGLAAPDLEAVIRDIRDQLAALPATAATGGTASSGTAPPLAAINSTAHELSSASDDCMHPAKSVDAGVCRECGTELDPF